MAQTLMENRLLAERSMICMTSQQLINASLPSYVKVQNLRNRKTVIVKVNDRGPFVDDRIIDLSYAAAKN